MSKTDASFDAIRDAIRSLWPPEELKHVDLEAAAEVLLLRAPNDVAAFAVLDGHPDRDFPNAYNTFKRLYRENSRDWDERTLSFVVCRSSDHPEDDKFYAALETDPLFCRKYVIRARDTVSAQREELLRLPFLPLPVGGDVGLQRPQPAQDLLQSASISASFARNLIEPGKRSAERIAGDLRDGRESLPPALTQSRADRLTVSAPRASSRLVSLTVEGFRAYRDAQTFALDASVVVLYGPNGLGKTSLFDAIDYASTGRIGRLCRTRRSQSDFARIATHLDKTPGTGSVVLLVKNDGAASGTWKLQRSTGDWTTGWIDGQDADRKAVINKLTQANWVDTTPRQQTLDSLFRATHLFGQDEQELLTEFKKGSVIPEAFISEMLSLQDYSEGLSKIEGVLSTLSDYRETAEEEVNQLREQAAALRTLMEEGTPDSGGELAPLESVMASLRTDIEQSNLGLEPLPDVSTAAAYTEWCDVVASRQQLAVDRMQLAQTLRDQLPGHHRIVREQADSQAQLDNLDREISEINTEERALAKQVDVDEVASRDAEARSRQLRNRLEDLRSASEALVHSVDFSKQIAALTGERDRQLVERADIDKSLAATGSAISKALADAATIERTVQGDNDEAVRLQDLLDGVTQFAEDVSLEAELRPRIERAREELRAAEARQKQAENDVQSTRRAREGREPEYQRTVAAQAQIDRLLDEIQSHVHRDECPLCGSKFESVEVLRAAIRQQRESGSSYAEVTIAYQRLVDEENHSSDRLKIASGDVTAAKTALDELLAVQSSTAQRLRDFRDRLAEAHISETDNNQLLEVLRYRQAALREKVSTSTKTAEEGRRNLQTLDAAQSDQKSKRDAIQERILALDRSIQGLVDQVDTWTARMERVVPSAKDAETTLANERQQVDKSIKEVDSQLQEAEARRKGNSEASQALGLRKQSVEERRSSVVATLDKANKSVSTFRQQLRTLGLPDDGDRETLDRAVREEVGRSAAIGSLAEKGLIVQSALRVRDVRRRLAETRQELEGVETNIRERQDQLTRINNATTRCLAIEALLKRERQGSIERHIAAYGPMITMIQQRLRSVYGFGGVQLEAHGGEAKIQVEWRSKSVQVSPTDFFSDSQKQILMLSIFMAGGLRQNWSGFAPVLLDDPVTHFDDLNAYAFVELIRGIVATSPSEWQFIVSTCEQRLFDLMQRKFSRLPSGAVFYEFLGMTSSGPIVERR